jgi:hypothetical protein
MYGGTIPYRTHLYTGALQPPCTDITGIDTPGVGHCTFIPVTTFPGVMYATCEHHINELYQLVLCIRCMTACMPMQRPSGYSHTFLRTKKLFL